MFGVLLAALLKPREHRERARRSRGGALALAQSGPRAVCGASKAPVSGVRGLATQQQGHSLHSEHRVCARHGHARGPGAGVWATAHAQGPSHGGEDAGPFSVASLDGSEAFFFL